VVEEFARESGADIVDVAAALASLAQGKTPLILSGKAVREESREDRARPRPTSHKGGRFGPQETYRLDVGRAHGVQPGNIVGAIANEADLDGSQINGIDIQEDHTFVRLPAGMPAEILERLQRVRVKGRPLAAGVVERRPPPRKKPKPHRGQSR